MTKLANLHWKVLSPTFRQNQGEVTCTTLKYEQLHAGMPHVLPLNLSPTVLLYIHVSPPLFRKHKGGLHPWEELQSSKERRKGRVCFFDANESRDFGGKTDVFH